MDKVLSTVILAAVSVTLAIAVASYYKGLVGYFMRYEQLTFDSAYVTLTGDQAEITITFRNNEQSVITVTALEINGVEMMPSSTNPFPIELPTWTQARLNLNADSYTFKSGITYEVGIETGSGRVYTKDVVIS